VDFNVSDSYIIHSNTMLSHRQLRDKLGDNRRLCGLLANGAYILFFAPTAFRYSAILSCSWYTGAAQVCIIKKPVDHGKCLGVGAFSGCGCSLTDLCAGSISAWHSQSSTSCLDFDKDYCKDERPVGQNRVVKPKQIEFTLLYYFSRKEAHSLL
jgi:hypothetical protein